MNTEEEKEFIAQIKEAIGRKRGYADYFCWPPNRNLEEFGIVKTFCESLGKKCHLFLSIDSIRSRGLGNDPPDCEAEDLCGDLVGIEVTELVDSEAIKAFINRGFFEGAEWDRDKLIRTIDERLRAKDKPDKVKGGPYRNYLLVIHTDEPHLNATNAGKLLRNVQFTKRKLISRAFLLFSYDPDPEISSYPYIELEFGL
jgi:hypothetical protein